MVRRSVYCGRLATVALVAIGLISGCVRERGGPGDEADQILAATGTTGGLVVHLGCGDGRLTAALGARDALLVHGLDADAADVHEARRHVRSAGLYGKVSIDRCVGPHLPYAENLVNLLVADDAGDVPMAEIMRVLAPGGTACVRQGDAWVKTVKPRPPEMDEWTHALHGPDNNAVAHDALVGPPRHLQWVGGPKWARSHDHLASLSSLVSSGGRVFGIVDEAPIATVALPAKWALVARDAFNGVVLWKRPVGPWEGHLRGFRSGPGAISRRLVADADRLYVTLGYGAPVTALDAATGETVRTYRGTDDTLEILHEGGTLFLVTGDAAAHGAAAADVRRGREPPPDRKRILAVDAHAGRTLWEKCDADTEYLMPTTLAVSGGRVFFQNTRQVVCVDRASGRPVWAADRPVALVRPAWSAPTLVVHGDLVLSGDRAAGPAEEPVEPASHDVEWVVSSRGGDAPTGDLIAFSAATGERLWSSPCRECYNAPVDVLVADDKVWTGDLVKAKDPGFTAARDPATGDVRAERPPDATFFQVGMGHHRCYRNKATDRYLVLGRAGVEFIDLESGQGIANHWVRGTCQYGVMPCNGLLYAPSHSCACFIQAKLNSFNALAAQRRPPPAAATGKADGRLERGPAYGRDHAASEADGDWPTYRRDPARSGCAPTAVPAALAPAWQTDLGGPLTTVAVADGRLYVAQVDAHVVHALDSGTGEPLWSYTAGGRVDSPPTVYQGLVLFGSADGCVYCLVAADGALVWRFRAAPEDRRIVAYDQVESVWPVQGSVLVRDGVAYCAAGRSSFLDGGIFLYRLDPRTGRLLSVTCVDSRDVRTGQEPQDTVRGTDMPGALPDVLSSEGESVFMRHMRFDTHGREQEQNVPHLFSAAGFLDGSWWHRTYWQVGTRMGCGYGGWPTVGNQVPAGRLLAVRGDSVYGYGRDQYATHGSHVGLGRTHYRLFACSREPRVVNRETRNPPQAPAMAQPKQPAAKKPKKRPPQKKIVCRWSTAVPVLARGMVLAGETLFVAGPPDRLDEAGDKAAAALDGSQGAVLLAVSAADGEVVGERRLAAPPVWDGMAAARGRLYMATTDGKVICMAGK